MSIGALVLDGDTPHIRLEGRNAKNRKAAQIALRRDIAGDLRNYLAVRLAWLRSGYSGQPIPLQVPATAQLFENMPTVKVFNLDLAAAGIATRDEETMRVNKVDGGGRTLDLHSLRHSFATLLGRSGASLQVAQVAMRHSDPKLTATTYTHLEMVDVGRALDALPELPMKASDSVAPNGCTSRWQYVQFGVMR